MPFGIRLFPVCWTNTGGSREELHVPRWKGSILPPPLTPALPSLEVVLRCVDVEDIQRSVSGPPGICCVDLVCAPFLTVLCFYGCDALNGFHMGPASYPACVCLCIFMYCICAIVPYSLCHNIYLFHHPYSFIWLHISNFFYFAIMCYMLILFEKRNTLHYSIDHLLIILNAMNGHLLFFISFYLFIFLSLFGHSHTSH